MKILNIIIVSLVVIQSILIKSLEAAGPSNLTLLYKAQLVHLYEHEVNNLALKYCVQFKNISRQILKNEIVQKAKTPAMQEFKANLREYNEMFELYTPLGLNNALLSIATNIMVKYYYRNDKDSEDITKLLKNFGYNEMLDRFERDFMNFVATEYLPKFEQFEKLMPRNETKEWQKLLKWSKELKKCKSYECVYKSFVNFGDIILTEREKLFAYINQQFINANLLYIDGSYHIVRGMLKHAKLKQLSPLVQQSLKQNLQQFIQEYEKTNRSLTKFIEIFQFVVTEFLDNKKMSAKDAKILSEIFQDQGYKQFALNYKLKLQKFVNFEVLKKFDDFQAKLSKNDLIKNRELIASIKRFKRLKSFEERKYALMEMVNT